RLEPLLGPSLGRPAISDMQSNPGAPTGKRRVENRGAARPLVGRQVNSGLPAPDWGRDPQRAEREEMMVHGRDRLDHGRNRVGVEAPPRPPALADANGRAGPAGDEGASWIAVKVDHPVVPRPAKAEQKVRRRGKSRPASGIE